MCENKQGSSELFKIKSGLWQGSMLSPKLFNIMSEICLEIKKKKKKYYKNVVNAGDVILWTNNPKEKKYYSYISSNNN